MSTVRKPVSLTFDNGPHPDATPDVLETLARHAVRASFFFVGKNLTSTAGQDLARRVQAAGHRIGNHTFSHGTPLGERGNPADAIDEIERAQRLIGPLADADRLFRPNGSGGGELDRSLLSTSAYEHLEEGGYTCVLWNSIPGDWHNPDGWLRHALADVERLGWPLVVIHDLPTGAMRHLESFILEARNLGAEFTDQFPADCVPLVRGKPQWDVSHLMTET